MDRLAALLWFALSACSVDPATEPKTEPHDPEIATVEAPPAPPPPPPLRVDVGDLDRIQESGALRILVTGDGEAVLPRSGASLAADRELAAEFAERLGLTPEFVRADGYDQLLPMLLAGQGDLVAAHLAVTKDRAAQVAFTRPTAVVNEILVGRKGEASPPRELADLAGRTVTVRHSSSYHETLQALSGREAAGVVFAAASEHHDTETLVHEVGEGRIAYTVCDSDLLEHILAYNSDVVGLFPLAKGRQIAWALRPTNPQLEAAADAFLVERAMSTRHDPLSTGDLAAIRARGSLRMLTRNNSTSYFLYKGTPQGFDYELAKRFAKDHDLRLDLIVPPEADDLIPWLLEGRGDFIAAELTVTPERAEKIAFSTPYLTVDEVLVQRADEAALQSLDQLRGKTIAVRRSSSYRRTLDFLQAQYGPFTIQDVPETLETEAILHQVAEGALPMTLADSTIAQVELTWEPRLQQSLILATGKPIAYGARKGNPELLALLDAWLAKEVGQLTYNVIKKRYFADPRTVASAHDDTRASGAISPYDELLRQRSSEYGLDWRLMASQAYQESRFDPQAKSWSGAQGLFQVMPATGKELGFQNLYDPDEGVHAGVRYMDRLIAQFEPELPFKQRIRFALASYNVGRGHVMDARRVAVDLGLDPNKWFGNVEKAMLALQDPAVAKTTKYGFCRATEPVHYVSEIQNRYETYVEVVRDR